MEHVANRDNREATPNKQWGWWVKKGINTGAPRFTVSVLPSGLFWMNAGFIFVSSLRVVEGETFCPCGSSFFVFLEPDCPSFLPGECRRWQLFFLHPQPKSIADNVSITKSELNFKDILRCCVSCHRCETASLVLDGGGGSGSGCDAAWEDYLCVLVELGRCLCIYGSGGCCCCCFCNILDCADTKIAAKLLR